MAEVEIEYSGIRHTTGEPEAAVHAFDATELKKSITAILPPEAVWEQEGGALDPEDDDGFQYYGVRLGEDFMPVFFHDDLNTVEYLKGSNWGKLVRAILALMEEANRANAKALGEKPIKLRFEEPRKSKSVPVYEIDFEWKF
jgi:hypothetical protein